MSLSFSIVIPTLNEAEELPATLRALLRCWPNAQVVVADGASDDDTVIVARNHGAEVVSTDRGSRGEQLCAGANAANGEWLLFLHADTRIDAHAAVVADAYRAGEGAQMGMFQLRFDSSHLLLRLSGWFTRFDTVFTRFGDQGILVRKEWYDRVGGFQSWPLFEDVDFIRRSRRLKPIDVLPATLLTSARRFHRRGVIRQQMLNAWLLSRFLLGADPATLRRHYPVWKPSN
ncbi:MAG: TIGR04283 family arsenosugar biosynthesis glycosyltransferase [Synoicihabitans sp.]